MAAELKGAERGLGHKLGPLPVWAWIVVGVGGAAGAYWFFVARDQAAASAGGASPLSSILPQGGGLAPGFGGSGGGSGLPPPPTSPPPLYSDNGTWLQNAIQQVAQGLGLPTSEVQLYLQEYLSGNQPVGNSGAQGLFQSVVNYALTKLGNPPTPPSYNNINQNPYSSNQTWLNSLLAFLPQGTNQSIIQELTNWINGTTNQLSQAAINALIAAEGIVGLMPQPLSYILAPPPPGPPGPPPPPPPGPPPPYVGWDWTQLTNWFQNFQNQGFNNAWDAFQYFISGKGPQGVLSQLSPSQQANFFNAVELALSKNGGPTNVYAPGNLQNIFLGILNNPNTQQVPHLIYYVGPHGIINSPWQF